MIRGIHYLSAEVKPKLMSSQGAALNQAKLYCHDGYSPMAPQFIACQNLTLVSGFTQALKTLE